VADPSSDAVLATRRRIFRATLACAARNGFRFTMEEVATEAGLSRPTVYRAFPGGKDELIEATITYEVARFLRRLGNVVEQQGSVTEQLVVGLEQGRRILAEHEVLQQVLVTDPDRLLPQLEAVMPMVMGVVRDYLLDQLRRAQPEAVEADLVERAEYVARLFMSYLGSHGSWDLEDPDEVRRLVRMQLLAALAS
jgi:AcrR family transcriptional regulator